VEFRIGGRIQARLLPFSTHRMSITTPNKL
jgi:hypothetical protein